MRSFFLPHSRITERTYSINTAYTNAPDFKPIHSSNHSRSMSSQSILPDQMDYTLKPGVCDYLSSLKTSIKVHHQKARIQLKQFMQKSLTEIKTLNGIVTRLITENNSLRFALYTYDIALSTITTKIKKFAFDKSTVPYIPYIFGSHSSIKGLIDSINNAFLLIKAENTNKDMEYADKDIFGIESQQEYVTKKPVPNNEMKCNKCLTYLENKPNECKYCGRKFCLNCVIEEKVNDKMANVCSNCEKGTMKIENKLHSILSIYSSRFDQVVSVKSILNK